MSKELFTTLPSLRIGKIVEVSGNQIKLNLIIKSQNLQGLFMVKFIQ
jgi:hypothetical protein